MSWVLHMLAFGQCLWRAQKCQSLASMPFYAVRKGRSVGIYSDWLVFTQSLNQANVMSIIINFMIKLFVDSFVLIMTIQTDDMAWHNGLLEKSYPGEFVPKRNRAHIEWVQFLQRYHTSRMKFKILTRQLYYMNKCMSYIKLFYARLCSVTVLRFYILPYIM